MQYEKGHPFGLKVCLLLLKRPKKSRRKARHINVVRTRMPERTDGIKKLLPLLAMTVLRSPGAASRPSLY